MKHIFMTMCSIILSPDSANQIRPKLCIDCKFYTKNFFTFSEFGKCSMFPTEQQSNDYYLVNGKNYNIEDYYHYCSTSRKLDHMCGKEGKFFEKKIKRMN